MVNEETWHKGADCGTWYGMVVESCKHNSKPVSSVTSNRFVEQQSNHYFLHTDEFLKWKTYWVFQTEITNVNKTYFMLHIHVLFNKMSSKI